MDDIWVRDMALGSLIVLVCFLAVAYLVNVPEAVRFFQFLALLGGVATVGFGAWAFSLHTK